MLKKKSNRSHINSLCRGYFMVIQHICFKIIGLAPWSIDKRNADQMNFKKHNKCNFSYVGTCYNILFFTFNVFLNFNFLINKAYQPFDSEQALPSTLREKISFILPLIINMIPLVFVIRQKSMIGIINRFEIVDEKLKKCDDYKMNSDYNNYFTFIVNFVLFNGLFMMQIYNFSFTVLFIQISYTIISSGVMIQYTILLNLTAQRFEKVNSLISKLYNIRIDVARIHILSSIQTPLSYEQLLLYDINDIIYAYVELCEICDNLKNFYGFPILVITLFFSAGGVFILYFIILVLISIIPFSNQVYMNLTLVSWITFSLIALTSSVTKTIEQSQKTVKLVNLLMLRPFTNHKIKEQLAQFSSVISHLKVKFTACDIMPLDRSLLAIISSTIATYLVIAVQFRMGSPAD
ncbi:putative gustatory receptor 28b [Microplitis mediator]|uniref:putative gustatory receptor 28b n=1 Tax=Microplitis mediator TaxID=375433 RepID=UPI002554AB44|nr:putative gustatory receptor 28b [Microplitis mediator]